MFSTNASQVSTAANYIEDVFSTYLYTGNSSTQTITNGIDLSGKGGLVWIKSRSTAGTSNTLFDTVRGATKYLNTNATGAQGTASDTLTAFNSTGFTLGADNVQGFGDVNDSTRTYASWTFRKQAKFFDVVTGTTDASGNLTISHNLGSVPGFVIVKRTDGSGVWYCYHTSLGNDKYIALNTTAASANFGGAFSASSTSFSWNMGSVANSATVVYLFAHNAGGFGLTGNDNVISCGSITGTGAVQDINLGYEPQWVLLKRTDSTGDWTLIDNMRGFTADGLSTRLYPNLSNAEGATTQIAPTATGFRYVATNGINTSGATGIYIAIRRGPMKVPTSGTSVFYPTTRSGTSANATVTGASSPPDLLINATRTGGYYGQVWFDKLRGPSVYWVANSSLAEQTASDGLISFNMNGVSYGADTSVGIVNNTGVNYAPWMFRRAPSFCDVVCYTGASINTTQTHNLGAVPELMIVKRRDTTGSPVVYSSSLLNTQYLILTNATAPTTNATFWNSTTPTASVFSIGTSAFVNASAGTYVAYLFTSCPGVSKVGSYTGTGATQTINCGFTGGARFVMVKRTDATGSWYIWDTARGMVAGTDPSLLFDSNAAEVNANSVYTTGVGFQIVSTAAGINASGGSYIFLAIA
jgi:hypothetical protein